MRCKCAVCTTFAGLFRKEKDGEQMNQEYGDRLAGSLDDATAPSLFPPCQPANVEVSI